MNKVAIVLTLMMILGACIVLISTRIKTKTIVYGNDALYGGIILQANGSTTKTIQLKDVSNRSLNTKVELKVRQGTVYLELLDDKGQPTSSLVATPEKPALSKGYLIADVSSTVKFRITAIEAENIEYSFTIDNSD